MSSKEYIEINIQVGGLFQKVKVEKGISISDGGSVFTPKKDGETFRFENKRQLEVFLAIANNDNSENINGIVLSKKDIDKAEELYRQGKLTSDLSEYLYNAYKIVNPVAKQDSHNLSTSIVNKITKKTLKISVNYKPQASAPKIKDKKDSVKNNPVKIDTTSVSKNLKTFTNPNIIEQKAFEYTVKKGEDVLSIAKKYELDTYQIIAANPQLKEGVDYTVTYRKNNVAIVESNFKEGTKIVIPPRYSVKEGSVRNFEELSKVTGLSLGYIKDLLTVIEVKATHPGKPDLTTYNDGYGMPTIGYGHTGKVDGKPLSLKKKITITNTKALQLLAEDLIKHEAMVISYLGKKNYEAAPPSVRAAIVDVAYNKGIWDGFMNPNHNSCTKNIKSNLEKKCYSSALANTRRMETPNRGLKRRNLYRFISGLTDLSPAARDSAIKEMQPYYNIVLPTLKSDEKIYMKAAWNNAKLGKTEGYRIQKAQTDRR